MKRRTLVKNVAYIYEQPTAEAVTKEQVNSFVSYVMEVVQAEFPGAHNYYVESNYDMLQVVVILDVNSIPAD